MRWLLLMLMGLAWASVGHAAPQDDELIQVELRAVSESAPGRIVIDRGSHDGLAIGDLVTFLPRSGATTRGSVRELTERSAVVDLFDRSITVPPGTRGSVSVPASRIQPVVTPPAAAAAAGTQTAGGEADPSVSEHEPWENEDETWQEGMPLLAEVNVLRPEERAPSHAGRIYGSADQMFSNDGGRASGFYRLGSSTEFSNSFGRGDVLSVDAELVYKNARNPDGENHDGSHLNIYELSYREGGTRFVQHGWEVGRFLQNGMPEFGYLDGFEWGQRLPGGDSWGASVGYMPASTDDQKSGEDMQFSGYYRWISDSTEQLTAALGYQKTFHNTSSDRDLVVTKLNWLPPQGWNFLGTAWVDFYNGGDIYEQDSAEVTLAVLSSTRRWEDGSRLTFTFNHQGLADLERTELLPPQDPNQYTDDRYSRLGVEGATPMGASSEVHGYLGGWVDQRTAGGNAGAGVTWFDLFTEDDSFDTTLFGGSGIYSDVAGARFRWGRFVEGGSWDLFYEVSYNHQQGFSSDRDDILQHWLGATRNLTSFYGWNLSLRGEAQAWDSFNAWTLGFYTQKSF